MSAVTPVEKIRIAITEQLVVFGLTRPESLRETILIRDGLYCGRKFQTENHVVVWFIEEDEIKFFNSVGELVKATSAISFLKEFESSSTSSVESRAA